MKQVAQALTLKMVLPEMAPHPSNPDLHVLNVKVARLGALTVKGTLSYADTPRDGESQALHGSSSNNDATKTDRKRQEGTASDRKGWSGLVSEKYRVLEFEKVLQSTAELENSGYK